VQKGVYDKFIQLFTEQVKQIQVGDGLNKASDIGPLINSTAVNKVDTLVKSAISEGASLIVGGKVADTGNQFYEPTLLVDVAMDMRIAKEEIFGPVAAVLPFETEQQAVEMANDTPYGLAAYFFTSDISRIWRVSEALAR